MFFVPMALFFTWLSGSFPTARLVSGVFGLFVAVGDPLVFALSKFKPELVPVERPAFFSPRVIEFVLSPFEK